MILETERLVLREMEQKDFQDLAEILQNPNVMYAYEHDFSETDVQEWLDRQIGRYRKIWIWLVGDPAKRYPGNDRTGGAYHPAV